MIGQPILCRQPLMYSSSGTQTSISHGWDTKQSQTPPTCNRCSQKKKDSGTQFGEFDFVNRGVKEIAVSNSTYISGDEILEQKSRSAVKIQSAFREYLARKKENKAPAIKTAERPNPQITNTETISKIQEQMRKRKGLQMDLESRDQVFKNLSLTSSIPTDTKNPIERAIIQNRINGLSLNIQKTKAGAVKEKQLREGTSWKAIVGSGRVILIGDPRMVRSKRLHDIYVTLKKEPINVKAVSDAVEFFSTEKNKEAEEITELLHRALEYNSRGRSDGIKQGILQTTPLS